MSFLEIENRNMDKNFSMSEAQFHDYYELYFLLEGTRDLFIENKMFLVPANSFCIIPPFYMHKTEGKPYKRINLYISNDLLDENEAAFLKSHSDNLAFSLSLKQSTFISTLLQEASDIQTQNYELRKKYLLPFAKTILYYLQTQPLLPLQPMGAINPNQKTDTMILKIVSYINENYQNLITLKDLSERFFISVNTLCKRFHKSMNCSIIEYVTFVRLNKAKMYLLTTSKKLEEISYLCGFSSTNYFGLIFKKQFGLSPLNYRKKK